MWYCSNDDRIVATESVPCKDKNRSAGVWIRGVESRPCRIRRIVKRYDNPGEQ